MNVPNAQNLPPILLVDDDPDSRWLVRESLLQGQVANPLVETADGNEALAFLFQLGAHAAALRPGLVFLDIEMPGPSGQEVLRQIKKTPQLHDIPVVMLTGIGDENNRQLAASSGSDRYIVKPRSLEELCRSVTSAAHDFLMGRSQLGEGLGSA
jgi:two-component system OmpR family response regulator/two-component system alkaline phosphatase synthesis response regulator PhoP